MSSEMPGKKKKLPSQKLQHRIDFDARMATASKHDARTITQHYSHNHAVELGRQAKQELEGDLLLQDDGCDDFDEIPLARSNDYYADYYDDENETIRLYLDEYHVPCPDQHRSRWQQLERERFKLDRKFIRQQVKFKMGAWGSPQPKVKNVAITRLDRFLLCKIRSYLPPRDSRAFACVCKSFHTTDAHPLLPILPDDLLLYICTFLHPLDVQCGLGATCRLLHRWNTRRNWASIALNQYHTALVPGEHPQTTLVRDEHFRRRLGDHNTEIPANRLTIQPMFHQDDMRLSWLCGERIWETLIGVLDLSRPWGLCTRQLLIDNQHRKEQLLCLGCEDVRWGWRDVQLIGNDSQVTVCERGHFWRQCDTWLHGLQQVQKMADTIV